MLQKSSAVKQYSLSELVYISSSLLCNLCLVIPSGNKSRGLFSGSNDYVNNYLQPFLADGQQYTHDEFIGLLISTLGEQFMVKLQSIQ